MEYRRMGNSGLRLSSVSIGGWLTIGGTVDPGEAGRILTRAVELGINFIDLADVYAHGRAEEVVGAWLRDQRRADLVISSKLFWPMSENPNDRGLSRKHIRESIEGSLRRLGCDYLDIYYCHRADPETPIDETAQAMNDLVRQGKVLYWGTSMWEAPQLQSAHTSAARLGLDAPRVEQPRYNLVDRSIEALVRPTAQELGMGLTVWSPLAQGLLTGKYLSGKPPATRAATSRWLDQDLGPEHGPENQRRVARLQQIAAGLGVSAGRLALAWVLHQPGITSAITGATRVEQVEENVQAAGLALEPPVLQQLDALFPRASAPGTHE